MRRYGKPSLIIIAIAYLILSAAYAVLIPAWESPDEPAHYLFTAHVARYARPPNPSPVPKVGQFFEGGYVTSMYEWYHPMLGYVWQALVFRAIEVYDTSLLPNDFPRINPGFVRDPMQNAYLFAPERTSVFSIPHDEIGLVILRLASALIGGMVIWAVYQAARFVFPDDDLFALTSAGALAFIPQFNFISASLRNDTVNNALSALCLVALLTIIARPTQYQWRAAFGIGGLLALAVLTKATAAFLLPTALVACACAPHSWRQRAQMAGAILIAFTLFVTAYFALYDEARIALDYSLTHATIASDHLELSYWLLIPLAMRDMFWARFGWANVSVSRTWINTATVLGLGGFTVSIARWCTWARRREWFGSTENRLLIVLFVALVGNLAVFVRYNLYEYQPQGRFLFPSLIALIILALWGPWQILPPKGRTLAAIMVPVAMLVFNLYALSTLIAAYY